MCRLVTHILQWIFKYKLFFGIMPPFLLYTRAMLGLFIHMVVLCLLPFLAYSLICCPYPHYLTSIQKNNLFGNSCFNWGDMISHCGSAWQFLNDYRHWTIIISYISSTYLLNRIILNIFKVELFEFTTYSNILPYRWFANISPYVSGCLFINWPLCCS